MPNKNIIKISNKEIAKELIGEKKNFPKYIAPLLNLANKFSKDFPVKDSHFLFFFGA
ncbi:hypothetical protein ES703_101219 [subsurface metagenome]